MRALRLKVQVPARAEEACQIYDPTCSQTDLPTQVPQDITLGLLCPKFTHKYRIQKEIIKYKGKVPVNNKKKHPKQWTQPIKFSMV